MLTFGGYYNDAGVPYIVMNNEPYSGKQIIWGSSKTAYNFLLHEEQLSPYSENQILRSVTEIGVLEVVDSKEFPYETENELFSLGQMSLTQSTVNKVFNNFSNYDNSFLVRNKLSEIRVAYESIFDLSTSFFSTWSCQEMENYEPSSLNRDFFFSGIDYDTEYKNDNCICTPNENSKGIYSYDCSNNPNANIPSLNIALDGHYVFLKNYLLSGFVPDIHVLQDYQLVPGGSAPYNSDKELQEL